MPDEQQIPDADEANAKAAENQPQGAQSPESQDSPDSKAPQGKESAPTVTEERATAGKSAQPPQTSEEKMEQINRAFKERETARRAKELGISYINIGVTPINPDLLRLITPKAAKKALILPFFKLGTKIRVAVADPENPDTREVIEKLKKKGYAININLATEEGITAAMQLYESEQYKVKKKLKVKVEEEKLKGFEEEIKELKDLENKLKTATSEEAVYLINIGALKTGASDIHYEPEEKDVRLRFRIDGMLHDIFNIDKTIFNNIANQIKYQCKLKLNITNEPQDGRYSFIVNKRKIDLRVSILPTQYGETYVCRLLDTGKKVAEFEALGFSGNSLKKAENMLKIRNGMILITGPTGSGKTTTLYSILEKFNLPELKVITLEDPIEYNLKGISQSQINEKRGYDFANGLRAILRQDPDVVMIGEVRDLETAEVAAQGALTGHIMLTTLHTNSAIEAIPRLINIGLPPFMVAPAVDTIIAQRLVRRFCEDCSEKKKLSKSKKDELTRTLEFITKIQPTLKIEIPEELPVARGCEKCSNTGYKGRVSIIEVVEVDTELRDLILNKESSNKMIEAARRKGMLTMYEDGILKVIQGVTSLTEVHRVTAIKA